MATRPINSSTASGPAANTRSQLAKLFLPNSSTPRAAAAEKSLTRRLPTTPQRTPSPTSSSNSLPISMARPAEAAPAVFDNLPNPGSFHGKVTENGPEWLSRFQLWADYRNLQGGARRNALALLLRDGASQWYRVLPDDQKDTYAHLKIAFEARYGLNPHTGWQRASALWNMTQGADEAVQDFIAKVRQAAADVNLPEEQMKFVIINGLRPALRAHAIRSNPADL